MTEVPHSVIGKEPTAPKVIERMTYSQLSTFRNCRKKAHWRYIEQLTPKYREPALEFGTLWHACMEVWDALRDLVAVLAFLVSSLPARHSDPKQRKFWHLGRAMAVAYARRWADDDAKVIAIEQQFVAPIINPATGAASRSFTMAGKVDLVFERDGKRFLRERKTASRIDQGYLERLWTDFQSQLYAYFIELVHGVKIHGVEYDIAVKARLEQREGETEDEFAVRYAEACAKNKSGKSSATRALAETDEDFAARLDEKYADPEMFHREAIFFSTDQLGDLRGEVWELTQAWLDARRRGVWYSNTSQCFAFNRPCSYFALCRSGGANPILIENLYDKRAPHEELDEASPADEALSF